METCPTTVAHFIEREYTLPHENEAKEGAENECSSDTEAQ
jgi:hypothetical protein